MFTDDKLIEGVVLTSASFACYSL